jgi:20S proteasome subunit beta 5
VLDTEYKADMTVEQAAELGRRAIYHATHRDSYSGGNVHGPYALLPWVHLTHDRHREPRTCCKRER